MRFAVFLFILVPWLIAVLYLAFNTTFIPDPSLKPWARGASIFLGAASLLLTPELWRAYQKATGIKEKLRGAVAMVALPFLTAFAGGHLVGAGAFALHANGSSQQARVVETVLHTSHSRRSACDYNAELAGNSILMGRKVCNIREVEFYALSGGGRIEITGRQSRWGMEVQEYKVLPD